MAVLVNRDVWEAMQQLVRTEAREELRRPDEDERWVSIWSRWPLHPTDLPADPRGAVSAIVEAPDERSCPHGAWIVRFSRSW